MYEHHKHRRHQQAFGIHGGTQSHAVQARAAMRASVCDYQEHNAAQVQRHNASHAHAVMQRARHFDKRIS